MTIKTLQLAFDAHDPDEIMRFWGRMLDYENDLIRLTPFELDRWREDYPQYDGRGRVDDAFARRMPIYIQRVPEAKSGRNRVRPEIVTPDLAAAGEHVDVEWNEYTVVGDAGEAGPRLRTIVIDSLDPERMLAFWSEATGYPATGNRCDPEPGLRRFEDGELVVGGERAGPLVLNPKAVDGVVFDLVPGLAFVGTDEPKTTKNRVHLDLWTTDAEYHRDRLVALGATVQRWDTDHVLLDPEGNEFCVS